MAGITHTVIVQYKNSSGTIVSTWTVTDGVEVEIDETIPGETEDMQIDIAVTAANIKAMSLYSDKAITIKTNDDETPDDTFELAAKKQLFWFSDLDAATGLNASVPVTTDLTALYVTNEGSSSANFKARFLLDQTP